MLTSNLVQWIYHPESLDRDSLYELRTLLARYPYCQSLRLLYLKNLYLLHDISFGQELRKAAVYVTDRRKLFYLIEGDKFIVEPAQEQPITKSTPTQEPGLDRTLSIIDTFLSNMPVDEELHVNNFQQISDYTVYLQDSESTEDSVQEPSDETPSRGQELIDSFIVKAETESMILKPAEEDESKPETPTTNLSVDADFDDDDETYFTETLAKIYVKQQRYSKALEIIKKLSLKYPKKNAYFADQIRFLEKVIINAKTK